MELEATWERCKSDLRPDGALRDIYVRDASIADWDCFLADLVVRKTVVTFTCDGEAAALPTTAHEAFRIAKDHSVNLTILAGRIRLCCHFFSTEELEFDLAPDDISNAPDFADLAAFMRRVGLLLEKAVILTPESLLESPIATYLPAKDSLLYHPRKSSRDG